MATVQVIFTHNDKEWEAVVTGATSALEARQAFTAVILTCNQLDEQLLAIARVNPTDEPTTFAIVPAVW